MGRAPCCEKVGLKKGRWTAEEDEILANYIKDNGEGFWRSLPKNAGLLRCGKSCRLRWINYLRADLKRGNISAEEDETIIKLHSSLGNRWSLIAAHLPGRTDNEIKNYWNSHLSRRIHSFRRLNGDGAPVIMDLGRIVGKGRRRRGGRTSRSAMEKKRVVDGPIAGGSHSIGGGAAFPTNHGKSEYGGGGASMGEAIQPAACGLSQCDPAADPQITFWSHEEQLRSSELLDLWETSEEMGSELFCQGGEMGGGFLAASEDSWCWISAEERESAAWCAVSSPTSDERELAAAMNSSWAGEERDGAPSPASSGLSELVATGSADGGETAAGAIVDQPERGRGEYYSSSAMDRWTDTELEEMAARLWEEAGEGWPWQWKDAENGGPVLHQFAVEEVGAMDSWFLSDIL